MTCLRRQVEPGPTVSAAAETSAADEEARAFFEAGRLTFERGRYTQAFDQFLEAWGWTLMPRQEFTAALPTATASEGTITLGLTVVGSTTRTEHTICLAESMAGQAVPLRMTFRHGGTWTDHYIDDLVVDLHASCL